MKHIAEINVFKLDKLTKICRAGCFDRESVIKLKRNLKKKFSKNILHQLLYSRKPCSSVLRDFHIQYLGMIGSSRLVLGSRRALSILDLQLWSRLSSSLHTVKISQICFKKNEINSHSASVYRRNFRQRTQIRGQRSWVSFQSIKRTVVLFLGNLTFYRMKACAPHFFTECKLLIQIISNRLSKLLELHSKTALLVLPGMRQKPFF